MIIVLRNHVSNTAIGIERERTGANRRDPGFDEVLVAIMFVGLLLPILLVPIGARSKANIIGLL